MWAQVNLVLRQAMTQVSDQIANFLPGVLVALVLILATFVVAIVVRVVLLRALRGLDLDRRSDRLGLTSLIGWSSSASPSQAIARVVYWTILVLGLLVSLTALHATIPSQLALSVFAYVPNLLAAFLILVVGVMTARFLARSALIGAVNMQIQSARLLSLGVKWVVLLVTVAMALDHLGIGRRVLLLAFGILFGGIVLAAALAIGLGARDAVGRTIERQLRDRTATDDRVDHV